MRTEDYKTVLQETLENLEKERISQNDYLIENAEIEELLDYINSLKQKSQQLKEEIRKYQKDRDINTKRHLEVQDYIKSRIQYCKEMTGFDCCIEELEEISKMV